MGRLGIYNGRAESKQPRGAGEGSSCTYIVQAGCVLLHLASGVYGGGVLFSLGLSSFFVSPLPSLDTPFLPLFLHIFCSGRPNASYGDVKKKKRDACTTLVALFCVYTGSGLLRRYSAALNRSVTYCCTHYYTIALHSSTPRRSSHFFSFLPQSILC